ncbi:MAG: acyltransferase [Bacteroidia bacterium]
MPVFPKENNFDLLRLFAAMQVLVFHTFGHFVIDLNNTGGKLVNYFSWYPGVLMFFTISGFLIASSLDRNSNIRKYIKNRFLRIYPALWFCFLLTLVLLFSFRIISLADLSNIQVIKWILTQISFLQFWTPDILRPWGVGTPNGSLWTIPVEIQFYIVLPIIMMVRGWKLYVRFIVLAILSLTFNYFMGQTNTHSVLYKLMGVTIMPYLWCFLTGSFIYHAWDRVKKYLEGKAIYWFIGFNAYVLITGFIPAYWPALSQVVSNLLLSFLTISIAFSYRNMNKILSGNDISYGIYIYHMLVINTFVHLGFIRELSYVFYAIMATTFISFLSWRFIESRALRFKI